MGQATDRASSAALDLVITNALIIDWNGIYKVRLIIIPLEHPYLSLIAGRHWSFGRQNRRYRQSWKSRCHGWRTLQASRRIFDRSYRRREVDRDAWCG